MVKNWTICSQAAKKVFWYLALLVIVLAIFVSPSAADEGDIVGYTGVDVVFLVDQSGSMGGSRAHPLPNDPNNLRFSGLQQMIDRLAGYRLNYFRNSDVRFQVGVVYFGSTTRSIVPPIIIDHDTSEQWQPLSERLRSDLSSDAFPGNLGNTHHLGALQEAKNMLREMERSWQDGQHIQVVLMLTDGEWYIDCPASGQTAPVYCQDGEFQSDEYQQALADYIGAELTYPRYRFFVGAINDRSGEYWSGIRQYWEDWTQNNARLVDTNTMWAFFEGILADLTVNEPALADKKTTQGEFIEIPETQDQIAVPPYLQEITFIIHKPAPEVRVKMYQDGQLLEELDTTIVRDQDQFIESITIRNPDPGYITIERPVTTGILRIFMIQIVTDVTCNTFSTIPQFIPVRLQCTLSSGADSLSVYNDPRFRLSVRAEIEGNGTQQTLILAPRSQTVFAAYYLPVQPGDYSVSIIASTQKPDGEPFELFRKPSDGMTAFKVEPTTPRLSVGSLPTLLFSVPLSITLVDPDGMPLEIPVDSAEFVQMSLNLTVANESFSVDLEQSNLQTGYRATFTPFRPGDYQVQLIGQVQDPTSGQQLTAFNQAVGDFEVLPPGFAWQGFSSPWPQYRPAPVEFLLIDQASDPIGNRLSSEWQLKAQATIQGAGSDQSVILSQNGDGHWTGKFTPQEAGDFGLIASAWAENAAGEEVSLVTDLPLFSFSVRSTTLIQTEVLRPANGIEHAWRDFFWRPLPLAIEVVMTDASGNPISTDQALQNPDATPFIVEVISPDGQSAGPLELTPGSNISTYLASFDRYEPFVWYAHHDLGQYSIYVRPVEALKETYMYAEPDGVITQIQFTRHSLWWVLPAIIGVLFILLIVVAAYQTYLRLWSIEGILSIEGAGPLWSCRLSDYDKHTVVFRKGNPSGVNKIFVHQPRGQRNPPIEVTVRFKRGARIRQRMTDGTRKALGGDMFISYRRGVGAKSEPKASLSLSVLVYGFITLLLVAGLGGVLFAVMTSLA